MTESEALARMIAPGQVRPGKFRGGVIQVHVTRACDQACYGCSQGSQLAGKPVMMTPEEFEQACLSLKGYGGVVGMFGGNPPMNREFESLCYIMRQHIPFEQRGLWCNNPLTPANARIMQETFNPAVSNLNCHMDREAYSLFKTYWPESLPFGLSQDSRHSPPYVAMMDVVVKICPDCGGSGGRHSCACDDPDCDVFTPCATCNNKMRKQLIPGQPSRSVVPDEDRIWEMTSGCNINKHWSALVGVVPGKGLRAFFCEIAYAQAALHADDPDWPDTGLDPTKFYGTFFNERWWQLPMKAFAHQVRQHCHRCGVPLQRFGQLAIGGDHEEVSATHRGIYRPKVRNRSVELVTVDSAPVRTLARMTDYLQNGALK